MRQDGYTIPAGSDSLRLEIFISIQFLFPCYYQRRLNWLP